MDVRMLTRAGTSYQVLRFIHNIFQTFNILWSFFPDEAVWLSWVTTLTLIHRTGRLLRFFTIEWWTKLWLWKKRTLRFAVSIWTISCMAHCKYPSFITSLLRLAPHFLGGLSITSSESQQTQGLLFATAFHTDHGYQMVACETISNTYNFYGSGLLHPAVASQKRAFCISTTWLVSTDCWRIHQCQWDERTS